MAGGETVIVDYGMGNLRSVQKAVAYVGGSASVSGEAAAIRRADRVILPGVGAFGDAKRRLEETGLEAALREVAASGRPVLGICLGMQLLFEASEEFGRHAGLGVFDGTVARLPDGGGKLKIPHMGWNRVEAVGECPLLAGLDGADFYFVHSFAVASSRCAAGMTEYGTAFVSVARRGNVHATQFHPEKSGEAGLALYRNWLAIG